MGAVKMLEIPEVTPDIYKNVLSYLIFLKCKWIEKIIARGCVDGRPQRKFISKEESISSIVSIFALMISCAMDTIEEKKVVTCDIPRAFL